MALFRADQMCWPVCVTHCSSSPIVAHVPPHYCSCWCSICLGVCLISSLTELESAAHLSPFRQTILIIFTSYFVTKSKPYPGPTSLLYTLKSHRRQPTEVRWCLMDDQNAIAGYYAVLIGIDAYPERPLHSCVSDIRRIKEFLNRKVVLADIQSLTASRSLIADVLTPAEDPERWPTCCNMILAPEKITCEAKRGDFVYIHYSGHGTRIRASTPFAFSNTSTGDLALVLLGGERGDRLNYLKGPTLAGLLNNMVKIGLYLQYPA
jgi:hypothetical protein